VLLEQWKKYLDEFVAIAKVFTAKVTVIEKFQSITLEE
jgi:hypothetical protein